MKRLLVGLVLFASLGSFNQAFSQSTSATVGGTVTDPSGAVLPGVSVTATNNGTAVVTTVVTNEAGAYNALVSFLGRTRFRRSCQVSKKPRIRMCSLETRKGYV